ncbi:MAG: hypothetical protein NTX79_04640 [Candidatus Micrarchaeota archaeon]|nr:hypothetical protein [Candidatus Micrarchaeota archaeon]
MGERRIRKNLATEGANKRKPLKPRLFESEAKGAQGKKIEGLKANLVELAGYAYRYMYDDPKNPDFYCNFEVRTAQDFTGHCTFTALGYVRNQLGAYANHPERRELLEKAEETFHEVKKFYDSLPYAQLEGRPEFYPLFVMRRSLGEMGREIENVKKNQTNQPQCKRDAHAVEQTCGEINCLFGLYLESVHQAAKRLMNAGVAGDTHVYAPFYSPPKSATGELAAPPEGNDPEKMKQKVGELARYYFTGMGDLVNGGLRNGCDIYVGCHDHGEKHDYWKNRQMVMMKQLRDVYGGIPGGDLASDPRYCYIAVGKRLAVKMDKAVSDVLAGGKPGNLAKIDIEMKLDIVHSIGCALLTAGDCYADEINALVRRIHAIPGEEKFHFETASVHGGTIRKYETQLF